MESGIGGRLREVARRLGRMRRDARVVRHRGSDWGDAIGWVMRTLLSLEEGGIGRRGRAGREERLVELESVLVVRAEEGVPNHMLASVSVLAVVCCLRWRAWSSKEERVEGRVVRLARGRGEGVREGREECGREGGQGRLLELGAGVVVV